MAAPGKGAPRAGPTPDPPVQWPSPASEGHRFAVPVPFVGRGWVQAGAASGSVFIFTGWCGRGGPSRCLPIPIVLDQTEPIGILLQGRKPTTRRHQLVTCSGEGI